jgi:hypothetical protein
LAEEFILEEVFEEEFGRIPSLLDPVEAEDVRLTLYRHPQQGDLVLHLVNHRVPIRENLSERTLEPVENPRIRFPVGAGNQAVSVLVAAPGAADEELRGTVDAHGVLDLNLPVLRDYALVRFKAN